jgi:hypothetical protein
MDHKIEIRFIVPVFILGLAKSILFKSCYKVAVTADEERKIIESHS